MVERRDPGGLPAGVEGKIPADGEQPRRDVLADPLRVLPAQTEERLLHDVPRGFHVAEEPAGVTNQRPLVQLQRVDHPLGLRRPPHSSLLEITGLRLVY